MSQTEVCRICYRTLQRANAMRRDQMVDFDASRRQAHIMRVRDSCPVAQNAASMQV